MSANFLNFFYNFKLYLRNRASIITPFSQIILKQSLQVYINYFFYSLTKNKKTKKQNKKKTEN